MDRQGISMFGYVFELEQKVLENGYPTKVTNDDLRAFMEALTNTRQAMSDPSSYSNDVTPQ